MIKLNLNRIKTICMSMFCHLSFTWWLKNEMCDVYAFLSVYLLFLCLFFLPFYLSINDIWKAFFDKEGGKGNCFSIKKKTF